jgi:hypothetical protein
MVQEVGATNGTEIDEIIEPIRHSCAHIKKAIRWPKWLLRNLSIVRPRIDEECSAVGKIS